MKKDVWPYLFRHTTLTNLAKVFTESKLELFAGWIQGSRMARRYVHFSGRDLENAVLELHGLKKKDEAEGILKAVECPRCGERNSADAGKVRGYEVETEYKIVGDLRLDVAYLKGGNLEAAMEVVLAGSVKEALFKLGLVKAKAKFLIVKEERMGEAHKLQAPDVKLIEVEKAFEAKTSVGALASLLGDIERALST